MLEIIRKTYRISNEELVELGTLTLQCNGVEDEFEIEVVFAVNGEMEVEKGYSPDVSGLDVKVEYIGTNINGEAVNIGHMFNKKGLEEEIKEYLVITDYDNLEFQQDISGLLESCLIRREVCEE